MQERTVYDITSLVNNKYESYGVKILNIDLIKLNLYILVFSSTLKKLKLLYV